MASGFGRKTLEPAVTRKPPSSSLMSSGCNQMAGLYDLAETLGKGHFAVVKAARHVFTGEKVAVKVIDKSKLDSNHQKALLKEVLCMKLVQHPHVVRLYEVIDTSSKLYLVLELGYGDLYDLIQRQQGGLPEDLARKYFCQILSAVSFCHKLHVVHRDLKPENVVFFPNVDGGQVKLTDFGFSNNYSPGVKLATSCGSLAYSAPEILLGDPYDAVAIDIWSLGVILYMLVAGRAPFQEANDSETLTMIMDVKYSIPPHVSSGSCRELIRSMLIRGPEKRATLLQIESHKWIQEGNYMTLANQTPLIVDHRLTPEERNMIIAQMECGRIATREQILESIQSSAYNHITSTFYLLAEKHLRERQNFQGTASALTSSLESLHDRRKSSGGNHSHSGTSDTDDGIPSETEDSLAPLDLEMKNASPSTSLAVGKKTGRIHNSALNSSPLVELDNGIQLPLLEENEDSVGRGEEDDNAGPLPPSSLPSSASHRRRTPYHNRRVMMPQRSASCSSSEDEDSEKKKRGSRTKIKVKHSECLTNKKLFDDESSDEQGTNGSGAGSLGGSFGSSNPPPSAPSRDPHHHHHHHHRLPQNPGPSESIITITPPQNDDENEEDEEDVPDESNNHLRAHAFKNGYTSDPDRHSCSDVAYAIEVNPDSSTSNSRANDHPPTPLSLAKKGKKLFFNWFFLKKKSSKTQQTHHHHHHLHSESPSTSVGIYKTKSFAELKLRSTNTTTPTGKNTSPNSMDVNMNL